MLTDAENTQDSVDGPRVGARRPAEGRTAGGVATVTCWHHSNAAIRTARTMTVQRRGSQLARHNGFPSLHDDVQTSRRCVGSTAKGQVDRKGAIWHVRFYVDVPSQEARQRKSILVGPATGKERLTRPEAKRQGMEIVESFGVNTEADDRRYQEGSLVNGIADMRPWPPETVQISWVRPIGDARRHTSGFPGAH